MGPETPGPEPEETEKGPDEAQFNLMEEAAKAGGAEAEARRQEMARWSEATGKYAEDASKTSNESADSRAQQGYKAEDLKGYVEGVNKLIAERGITDDGTTIKARPEGMHVDTGSRIAIERSPAQFRQKSESADQEQTGDEQKAA